MARWNPKKKKGKKGKKNQLSLSTRDVSTLVTSDDSGLPMSVKHVILGVGAFAAGYIVSKFI